MRRRPLFGLPLAAHVALVVMLGLSTSALAQPDPCVPNVTCPTPSPTPAPSSGPGPTPTPTPSRDVTEPSAPPVIGSPEPTPTPTEPPIPAPAPEVPPEQLPPELEQTFQVPVLARTRARNTLKLVEMLEPLTEYGLPLEQVLVGGMGRFPVAGVAFYSDDWLNPRFNPEFHLHQGVDIFADFGTPIRATDDGRVLRFSDGGAGGVGVWTVGKDGTQYYFAHLQSRAEDIRPGMNVSIGTVLGFVGDTGNAQGGAPHLHFEVHPGGGPAVPPKPSVDRWLDEAEQIAPRWVELQKTQIEERRRLLGDGFPLGGAEASSDLEATMLLTLLDPVGGSVGMLPRLELKPAQRAPLSAHLLEEVVRLRLHGYVLAPGAQRAHVRD